MLDNKNSIHNKDPPQKKKQEFNLEEILKVKPSLDTDVMDFLLIAGWDDCYKSPIYKRVGDVLWDEINKYIDERRENLSKSDKHRERRFCNSILEGGYGKEFKTLGEFKTIVESEGMRFRNMHYKTFAHFNKTLKEYGIEPIKVGGKYTRRPSVLRELNKYGLEPVKTDVNL